MKVYYILINEKIEYLEVEEETTDQEVLELLEGSGLKDYRVFKSLCNSGLFDEIER